MLYTPIFGNSLDIIENIGIHRKEVAASLVSVAAPLRFWIFFVGNFERFEILENYEL